MLQIPIWNVIYQPLKWIKFIFQVETKDALLHAINEEFVEAVEVLLEHEETIHKEGEPHVSTIKIGEKGSLK